MIEVRKLGVAAGTFTVALGIGFVMQNGDALASRMGQDDGLLQTGVPDLPDLPELPVQSSVVMPALPDVAPDADLPIDTILPSDIVAPAILPEAVPAIAPAETLIDQVATFVSASDVATATVVTQSEPVAIGLSCDAQLSATAATAATVLLELSAPCSTETRVTIHHNGMIFSASTDADGQLSVTAPALSETAVFMADVGGETGAVAVVQVPELALYDRTVLQWRGEAGFELHARGSGTDHLSAEHVSQAPALTEDGTSGFMMMLGDAASASSYMAQVYTYPSGYSGLSGDVQVTVEAHVTAANCGRTFEGHTLQVGLGDAAVARDLEMTLSGCDAIGDVLVLNNIMRDLTLASR